MLTAAEVAVILGLKPRTVYDLHASGALTGYRFGRAVRYALQAHCSFIGGKVARHPLGAPEMRPVGQNSPHTFSRF